MPESLLRTDEDFEAFYAEHYKMVYRICYMYMKNSFDAEDCTEDTFVKVLTGKYIFNDKEHEKKWLTVTAMNICKDKLKRWWRKNTVSLEECTETAAEDTLKIDETLKTVMELPAKYKDAVYLYYYMGYKTDEIAKILHKPASTIRNHLRDARAMLKDMLGGE